MSRLTLALLCFVLLSQAIIHKAMANESVSAEMSIGQRALTERQQQQEQQRAATGTDIDLTELTPSLEHQLYQAKRLNRADSPDWSSNLVLADDALRYDMLTEPASQDRVGTGERLQMINNLKRRAGNGVRFSRGLNYYNGRYRNGNNNGREQANNELYASPILNDDQNREDKDYAFVSLPASLSSGATASSAPPSSSSAAIIDNHESASRDSLWTSKVLRDLLNAQEARTRAKNLDQLARLIARQRATSFGRAGGDGEPENREKRRRCKVDPNLGVKNPSFCDTDAYFGAQDYTQREIWDMAGR